MMKKDSFSSVTVTNDYSDEFNDLRINDLNFMPYYEIRLMKDLDTDRFDIYEDDSGDQDGAATGWDAFIPINYDKLSRYIQIQLSARLLDDGSSKYVTSDFRRCTEDDFRKNGFEGKIPLALEKILCPDSEPLDDYYRIANGYANVDKKRSFSLEVITCNADIRDNCASEPDI